jgi:hypothetical protein
MTGKEDNVGFLATESGLKQFQPCFGGSFVLKCRRFFTFALVAIFSIT